MGEGGEAKKNPCTCWGFGKRVAKKEDKKKKNTKGKYTRDSSSLIRILSIKRGGKGLGRNLGKKTSGN